MLLKSADDKSKRLALLEDLQKSTALTFSQKKWLRDEFMRLRKGIQGERDAAHYLDNYFKGGANHVLLHDLRFKVDGDVAQIDHLVINRGLGIYLIETKNYAGNLIINEYGEFTVDYDGDRFGIPSPIEQSHRHERVLARLLDTLGITQRWGGGMRFYHVVMFHPKAVIERPSPKALDTSMVIKADQFPSWHKAFVEKEFGFTDVLKLATNLRSMDTLKEWGEKLIRQHRPGDLLSLPDFIKPRVVSAPPRVAAQAPAFTTSKAQETTMATVPPKSNQIKLGPVSGLAPQAEPLQKPNGVAKKLICAHCGAKISYAEGKFCWNNSNRFDGLQYCREHQSNFLPK
jgi:hypothetical protein